MQSATFPSTHPSFNLIYTAAKEKNEDRLLCALTLASMDIKEENMEILMTPVAKLAFENGLREKLL